MILTEQKYKRLNRDYYHGQEYLNRDPTLSKFNCFYLSTDPYYSYQYAKPNGYIKVYHIVKALDICNLKSKNDSLRIENYIRKYKPKNTEIIIKALANQDWFKIFKNNYRETFLNFIKRIGYDGYFNIECEDPNNGRLAREDSTKGFPSIGIFDVQNLKCIKTLHTLEDFKKIDRLKDIRNKEILFFKKQLYLIWKDFGELKETEVKNVLRNFESEDIVRLVTSEDILNMLNNFDPEDVKKTLKENYKIRKLKLKAWWGYEPSIEQIQSFNSEMLSIFKLKKVKGEFIIDE